MLDSLDRQKRRQPRTTGAAHLLKSRRVLAAALAAPHVRKHIAVAHVRIVPLVLFELLALLLRQLVDFLTGLLILLAAALALAALLATLLAAAALLSGHCSISS
jgi:hypothetical protein